MSAYFACNSDEVKEGRGKKAVVDGEEIVIFKVEGQVCAVLNVCPHQKFQKLHEGMFENGIVTCPMHGWAYDVRTGISTNADGRLKTFPVEIKNGKVFVEI
ncbi:MAG: Rieske (2Fe-2S) protein [Ignavibacteriales bacterium]|nr:Rieske (2Fe-2S) protein [Ignavibacteriales bacterium]